MPEIPSADRAAAQVIGLVQGQEIHAEAQLTLAEHALTFTWPPAAPWQVDFDGLDGIRIGARDGTLYLAGHDILECRGDEALRPLLRTLQDRLCRVPELLRSVRYFGALDAPSGIQRAHDCWFAPLLAARRALEGVSDPLRQVALCDADAMASAIRESCGWLAAQEAPEGGAMQRALTAQLEEAARETMSAVASMGVAAEALRRGDDDRRFADWRQWIVALETVGRAFESGWCAVAQRLP